MQVMGVVGEGRRSSEDPVDNVAVLVAGELWPWLCPHACIQPAAIIHTFSLFSIILLSFPSEVPEFCSVNMYLKIELFVSRIVL